MKPRKKQHSKAAWQRYPPPVSGDKKRRMEVTLRGFSLEFCCRVWGREGVLFFFLF